jgi:UDP-glucuronate 4-epimerase
MRAFPPAHSLLASTSSVYGANTEMPYAETAGRHADVLLRRHQEGDEAMAHSYAHLYDLPTTMFRFFTVYGPWGRPDMAPYKFTRAILEGRPIDVYNHGQMSRDFTYIDDLVDGIVRLIEAAPVRPETARGRCPRATASRPSRPIRIVNIGNSEPVALMDFIGAIEAATGMTAKKNFMDMQPGDVPATWADATLLQSLTGYRPKTDIQEGVDRWVAWYRDYYGV